MEPGGSILHSQGLSNNPYPEPKQPIDTYFFKIHSNIVLIYAQAFLEASFQSTLHMFLILTVYVNGTNYEILHEIPFSSLLGLNTHLRILFSNTPILHSSLNIRYNVSQPYSTTGNIIESNSQREDKSVWTEKK